MDNELLDIITEFGITPTRVYLDDGIMTYDFNGPGGQAVVLHDVEQDVKMVVENNTRADDGGLIAAVLMKWIDHPEIRKNIENL